MSVQNNNKYFSQQNLIRYYPKASDIAMWQQNIYRHVCSSYDKKRREKNPHHSQYKFAR